MDPKVKLGLALKSETPESRPVVPLPTPTITVAYDNIQGDIFPGLPKTYERFIFFSINANQVSAFRTSLGKFREKITTSAMVIKNLLDIQTVRIQNIRNQTNVRAETPEQYQIAFSWAAFKVLEIDGEVGDGIFQKGPMYLGASDLGDPAKPGQPQKPDWDDWWLDSNNPIHGVITTATKDEDSDKTAYGVVVNTFGETIKILSSLLGTVAPGDSRGQEHFGFQDGISQPAMRGMTVPHPGQLECDAGVLIHGTPGDLGQDNGELGVVPTAPLKPRPWWATGGSMMAFRQLQQHVLDFHKFTEENPAPAPPGSDPEPSDVAAKRRGALMFGRWQSGCPLDKSQSYDNAELGRDARKNNDFNYDFGTDFSRCPVTAHIRKDAPRKIMWLNRNLELNLVMRGSVPYGPWDWKPGEKTGQVPEQDRGLLYTSYQSHLNLGFDFLQQRWSNNVDFPPAPIPGSFAPTNQHVGFDPIVGAANGKPRYAYQQQTPGDPYGDLRMQKEQNGNVVGRDFITPRGGEYFWVPGMIAIDNIIKNDWKEPNGSK